jgi:hypothetical protein
MSSILYYSNFCEHSKKLLQNLSKTTVSKEIHFICIDNRVKDKDNKIYIVLQNGQKIIMPENVTKVPALLLLNQNYKVLYGESIYDHFKPQEKMITQKVTQNNLEPMAFSFGGFGGMSTSGGIASDNYSFLDMDSDSLATKGNGGLRQMHSYVSLNDNYAIPTPNDEHEYNTNKIKDGEMKIEDLQRQRDEELSNINYRKV